MTTAAVMIAALLLDRALGEVRRAHPLVGFGRLAVRLEGALHGGQGVPERPQRLRGVLALALLVVPLPLLLLLIADDGLLYLLLEVAGLYLCLGRQSLAEHARAIAAPLGRGELEEARRRTGYIVSRNTEQMDPPAMARAAVESVLENGNDACFATLFWFAVAGLPGALLHRLANTLDAMWGYRSPRYHAFGWGAARFDDLLGWLPARLCALAYALAGETGRALACWRRQAHLYSSPNGGPVMAAGAGALGITLGGEAIYRGQLKQRPLLGEGPPAAEGDIERSLGLLNRAVVIALVLVLLVAAALPLAGG